jgi:hypothetical protein
MERVMIPKTMMMIMMMMIKKLVSLSEWNDRDVAYLKDRKPSAACYM